MGNFELTFYPDNFSKGIERLIKKAIKDVLLNHPLRDETSFLLIDEIKIYVDDNDLTDERRINYRPKWELLLLEIGLRNMLRDEYLKEPDYGLLLSRRGEIPTQMIDIDKLKTTLFHEFGHLFDQISEKFAESDWTTLTEEQLKLENILLDVYVDGRLSRANIPILAGLEGRIWLAKQVLESANVNVEERRLVDSLTGIWNSDFMKYEELIRIVNDLIPIKIETLVRDQKTDVPD